MGLFGSKSKTYTSNNVSRMIDDRDIKPMSSSAIISYLKSPDSSSSKVSSKSLADYLVEASSHTVIAKLKKAHRISKADTYALGEMQASYRFKPLKEVVTYKVTSTLTDLLGFEPTVVYNDYGQMNYMHAAYYNLQEHFGYDPISNEVTVESERIGKPVYLRDITIYMHPDTKDKSEQIQLVFYGSSPRSGYTPFRIALERPFTLIQETEDVVDSKAIFEFCYKGDDGKEVVYTDYMEYFNYFSSNEAPSGSLDETNVTKNPADTIAPTFPDESKDQDYVMAYYTYEDNGKQRGTYFIYQTETQLNSVLESIIQEEEKTGVYPPRIYARMNGAKYTNHGKDSAKYKSMVKVSKAMGIVWKDWVDEVHDGVDGLEHIREMFMTFGLQANTSDPIINQYLFHYFEEAYRGLPGANAYITSGGYKGQADASATNFGAKQGASIWISDREHRSGISFSSISLSTVSGSIGTKGTYTSRYSAISSGSWFSNGRGCHEYMYQLTEKSYISIKVYKLTSHDVMSGGTTFSPTGTSDDLLVPLDLSIKANMNIRELEELYAKSMFMVVNTSQTVKQKWYQTGVFKFIMIVIAVVVTYFFPPAGIAMLTGITLAIAAVAVVLAVSLALQVLQKIVIAAGLDSGAFQTIMIVIAVAAAVYGGYVNTTGGTGIMGLSGQSIMMASNAAFAMANAGNQAAMQKAIKSYQNEVLDLQARDDELKDKVEALGLSGVPTIDVLMYLPPNALTIALGEEPEDYYQKSIHSINVGTYVYDYIESYVEVNTLLPDIRTISQNLEKLNDKL